MTEVDWPTFYAGTLTLASTLVAVGPEHNSLALFRGDRGTEAVVIERHH